VHETATLLLVTLPNIHRLKKICFTHRLSNKPLRICLLTTPPLFKYVATLLCNLSIMACFADIYVSQGSVATYARCDGIVNIHLTTNLPRNLSLDFFLNRLIFYYTLICVVCMVTSLWPHFLAHYVYYYCFLLEI